MTTLLLALALVMGVESSSLDPNKPGDHGEALGCLQIRSGVVQDVNRLTGSQYTHADAEDPAKARRMFIIYETHYCTRARLGHEPTLEDYSRVWNGGPRGFEKPSTLPYWHKIEREYAHTQ